MNERQHAPDGFLTVSIVPHTHWDREWYAPFQHYRLRLVHLVDGLLDLLENNPSFTQFHLDGQTAVIDDYLEVRPEQGARIAALVAAGRLHVGPWMVLMDEFMVSGETIVRDLQLGVARTTELGGTATVGYLPDMFGHVAQMPQLLRLAGIEHAVVWRGVPSAVDRTAFWWDAPDGSRVRAEYLYGSYSNGRDLPPDPAHLVARAHGYELELGDAALPGGGLLLMNGSDHLFPQPHLGSLVAAANAEQRDYHFTITSLAAHVATQPVDGLPSWAGELRSGARANLLMGVASNRVDVHRAAAAAERALERRAEPLSALLLPAGDYPASLLRIAWRNLVLNSAHDSSCACSHDEVVDAVRVRYQEARHIGESLARDALAALGGDVDAPASSLVAVNATARPKIGMMTSTVPGSGPLHLVAVDDGSVHLAQVVRETAGDGLHTTVTARKIRWVLEMMRGPELAGARIARVERSERDDGVAVFDFHDAAPGEPAIDLEATRDRLLELGDAGATITIRQHRAPVREVVTAVDAVPAFGWRSFTVREGHAPAGSRDATARAEGKVVANGFVTVAVDPSDGTLAIEADGVRVAGANRYVDGGDGGDTYNYSPPATDRLVDTPDAVQVDVLETGPVRARLAVVARYRWPTHAIGDARSCADRSDDTVDVDIRTTVELRAGERFVRLRAEFDNHARDHRLRAHFPLPARVDGSHADCAFAVVRRGLTAEGGPHETGLPTFVSRRFVDCSGGAAGPGAGEEAVAGAEAGLALLHDGLLEYEVTNGGTEVALTLLRATGYLSRSEPAYRPNPAGPLHELQGPQLQQRLVLDYAVLVHRGDWAAADLDAAADDFLVPLEHTHARRDGARRPSRAPTGSALSVDGARVSAVTRDDGGALVLRLVNASPEPSDAVVSLPRGPASGDIVDLVGRAQRAFDGSVPLRPWEIVTLRLH